MKTHFLMGRLLLSMGIVVAATTVYAARTVDKTSEYVEMEKCFKEHGKLMGKPALTNIYDCWRAHAYLYRMNR